MFRYALLLLGLTAAFTTAHGDGEDDKKANGTALSVVTTTMVMNGMTTTMVMTETGAPTAAAASKGLAAIPTSVPIHMGAAGLAVAVLAGVGF
ncbi:hypothetical protein DM02DRAFT_660064 [Periconia macrospinosa]|uniref:Uncharacterized protein n=1 Tax=Periconia macrospinosa TaxID=97972 RepID=A0A2V1DBL6_9PLEO|nr:hypothetical protein DM02DRAFT_660064 [Periconia macrospinosa]